MRKSLLISVLTVLLSVSAYAGEMQCPVAPPPPPPPAAANEDGTQGGVTQAILNVLGSVLALI